MPVMTRYLIVLMLLPALAHGNTDETPLALTSRYAASVFPLVYRNRAAPVYVDVSDETVVGLAARAFSEDVRRVSGISPKVRNDGSPVEDIAVIAGTLGKSALIDSVIKQDKNIRSAIEGRWECYYIGIVAGLARQGRKTLVIAGSDPRGTAFGIFELSRRIGVSPWYWWADVHTARRKSLLLSPGSLTGLPPSVRYRGIFLNDEDWGLQPWAAKNIDTDIKDIGPRTYSRIFELLLRLKLNLIWPAMHPSTKAFFYYPQNSRVARDYSIIIGTSHAEPMLRNNVDEWEKATMGDFNYFSNKQKVYEYWDKRVQQSRGLEALFTVGMRGVHDSGMEGAKNQVDAARMLENVISDQRAILKGRLGGDVSTIPQVFTLYKEVLDLYDQGMTVPEDITLVWPDDNYGYIQRLSNRHEQRRKGGAGVYYHASYWGRPHDYLWLGTTHPVLMTSELMKAFAMKADRLWVLNVGDIKPLEYNIQMFSDMAYHIEPFKESGYTRKHLSDWATGIFGKRNAMDVAGVLWEYYELAFERRPEFMGWSQTEPTTPVGLPAYNIFSYGDEVAKRLGRYEKIQLRVQRLLPRMGAKDADAFRQLVYYPVTGAALMNKKFLYRQMSLLYAKEGRMAAQDYGILSQEAHDEVQRKTLYYNTRLSGGKWNGMMSASPRNLPVFQRPDVPGSPVRQGGTGTGWAVRAEGADEKALPAFTPWGAQQFFIDIYLKDSVNVRWSAAASAPFRVSEKNGILIPELRKNYRRIFVSVDWNKMGRREAEGTIRIAGGDHQFELQAKALNPLLPAGFSGFAETNGYISFFASSYTGKADKDGEYWQVTEGAGYTPLTMTAGPFERVTDRVSERLQDEAPFLEYEFCTFSVTDSVAISVFALPTHPLTAESSLRYGVQVDDGPVRITDFRTYGRSNEWKNNVLSNSAVRTFHIGRMERGQHTLKIFKIDPGVVLSRILISTGNIEPAYSTIPETKVPDWVRSQYE